MGRIYFDLCAIVILATLFVALIVRRLVKGRSNQLLLLLIACILITGIIDAWDEMFGVSIVANERSLMIRYVLDYVYFLLRNFTAPLYIMYICSFIGIWNSIRNWTRLRILLEFPYTIVVFTLISNLFTHKVFYMDENFIYHRGQMIYIIYAVAFYYMILGTVIFLKFRHLISRNVFWTMLWFMPANYVAVMIEMIDSSMRIEIFASAIMVMVLTIAVQKPEEMVDYYSMALGYNAFISELKKCEKSHSPFSLVYFRFSNHKGIRDSIGLMAFSELLKSITAKMTQIGRVINLHPEIYYLDNGTYAIMCSPRKYEVLLDMGRFIMSYMQEPMKVRQMEIALDTKACIIHFPYDYDNVDSLVSFAYNFDTKIPDQRRVIEVSKISENRDFKIKNDMDLIISHGISNHCFKMYYQPIYSIKEDKFVSAEALIRFFDDTYGFISPGLFIPAAEESGAIHQIGDFVLNDVCRFISEIDMTNLGLEYVEINLSVAQCIETNLAEKVLDIMSTFNLDPSRVNLEITETGVDYDPETTDRNIKILHEKGISFSLDDYGVGYSNIKRVVTLPLEIVKLDKSLVDEMDNPIMWSVITSTVRLLKKMNKHILVEGIEDERAFNKFKDIGCDYIQGYYFSKPLAENDFIEFIERANKVASAI
ncbi:MAG: EAL domain-containing protein [Lachnospiraceae bacterium]|nr:EAL domain-containing protein [Lachnospiraceae bacterium]